jgi:hypothetical protein
MDGSGKSVLAQKYVLWYKGLLLHGDRYTVSSNSFNLTGSGGYWLLPLVLVAFFDCLYTYYTVHRRRRKEAPLICDRYFYDKVARLIYYGICPCWLAKIIIKLLPKPTITEVLITPYILKQEITDHKRWQEIYSFIKWEIKKITYVATEVLP